MHINQIKPEHIQRLSADQLVELLDKLLRNETIRNLPSNSASISVPKPITLNDAGEDARIVFEIPDKFIIKSVWITHPYTIFQSKSTDLSPAQCKKEVLSVKGKRIRLKEKVDEAFSKNGEYILFTTGAYSEKMSSNRIAKIREAIKESGKKYSDSAKIKIYDSNKIARWTNEYIDTITYVQYCLGIERPSIFRTWEEWDRDFIKLYEYEETDYLLKLKRECIDILTQNKVVRVLGKRGIGKSRFILESFNPVEFTELSRSIVYIDLSISSPEKISEFIINHRQLQGILVIDNCDENWHQEFSGLIKSQGNLSIITMDYELTTQEKFKIIIDRKKQYEVVKNICRKQFYGTPPGFIERVIEETKGYPEMLKIIQGVVNETNIYDAISENYLLKYLFGRDIKNDQDYELLKACSIFTHFGFIHEDYSSVIGTEQQEIIKQQQKVIYEKISTIKTDEESFYRFCKRYRDRKKLLDQRGLTLRVIPEPIAAKLAVEWWYGTSFEYLSTVIPDLVKAELIIPLCDRLKDLDRIPETKKLVAKLWAPESPFSSIDTLNTELGSHLFRSIVEVNPVSALEALKGSIGELSKEEILRIGPGRRNLVGALEMLCFRKETFLDAAKILYDFAVSENENWANNATGQFLQLFQIYLPGTEVDYNERIKVLEYGLDKDDEDFILLAISAMSRALQTYGLVRMGGAEQQGSSRPLKDYEPKNNEDVYLYHEKIIALLRRIADRFPGFIPAVKEIISSNIRSLITYWGFNITVDLIEYLHSREPMEWSDLINNIRITQRHEKLSEEINKEITDLIEKISPKDISGKIKMLVSVPDWDLEKEEDGSFKDLALLNATKFAEDLVTSKVDVSDYLTQLLSGEQRQGIPFGKKLGSLLNDKDTLLSNSIKCLKTIPKETQSVDFLIGLLQNFDEDTQKRIVKDLLNSAEMGFNIIYLARWFYKNKNNILEIISLSEKGRFSANQIKALSIGYNQELSIEDITEICRIIFNIGEEFKWIALEIIGQYCYKSKERFDMLKDLVKEFAMGYNFFTSKSKLNQIDDYTYSQMLQALLADSKEIELAEVISSQLTLYLMNRRQRFSEIYVSAIVNVLVKHHFKILWDKLSKGILGNPTHYLNIKFILGAKQGNGYFKKSGNLFHGDPDVIISWCKSNLPKGALRIAYMMPISVMKDESTIEWHPFALKMINEFSEVNGFMKEVGANIFSFGWSGSTIPYYEGIKELMQQLSNYKSRTVRQWAGEMIKELDLHILKENIDEERWS